MVIRLSAMGDVAMTVPVLRAFSKQHPNIKVTVLTRPFFAPFFDDIENVDVITAHFNAEHKGVNGLFKLSKQLNKINIDAIADLHNVLRTRILKMFLVGKPFVHIDKGRAEKKALVLGKDFKQLKTTHQRYADVFEKLGFKVSLKNPEFPVPKTISPSARKIVGNCDKTLIGIAPFAQHKSKEYPFELMEKVIVHLSKSNEYDILLFGGGKREEKVLNGLEVQYENVTNIAGKISFRDELAVISNLSLMLSMDSGNAHIAAMYGVEVVTLWGVTHPYAGFYPFGQRTENAILSDRDKFNKIPTSIYGNKFPKEYENVMESIDYKTVILKIESIVKK